jgi:hypothetical protein
LVNDKTGKIAGTANYYLFAKVATISRSTKTGLSL